MKQAVGFLGGQYGDAITTLGAVKVFSEDYPDYEMNFALSEKYAAILPLFEGQPGIARTHIWEGYDNIWPTAHDEAFIKDMDLVFCPMQDVGDRMWHNRIHQVTLCCERYGLRAPDTNEVTLERTLAPNNSYKSAVCLSVFPNNGEGIKSLLIEDAEDLTNKLIAKGQRVIQLAGERDPIIKNAEVVKSSYLEAVRILLASKLLVCGDTSMSWVASAYKIPVVGAYAYGYHPGAASSRNWQPVNPNAKYLDAFAVSDISVDSIISSVEDFL